MTNIIKACRAYFPLGIVELMILALIDVVLGTISCCFLTRHCVLLFFSHALHWWLHQHIRGIHVHQDAVFWNASRPPRCQESGHHDYWRCANRTWKWSGRCTMGTLWSGPPQIYWCHYIHVRWSKKNPYTLRYHVIPNKASVRAQKPRGHKPSGSWGLAIAKLWNMIFLNGYGFELLSHDP